MNNRFIRKTLLIAGVLLLTLGISWQPALAKGKKKQLLIKAVYVDVENNELRIWGENFDNKKPPVVTLGDDELTVLDNSADEIVAELPEDVLEGDYLLTVKTDKKSQHFDSYGLTIGAMGPEGPQGEVGPQGESGPPGADGKDGVPGKDGVDGAPGADGAPGLPGSPGADGKDGVDGPQGPEGPTGPKGDKPAHQWAGTKLAFENPDGTMGSEVDLKGEKGDQGPPGQELDASRMYRVGGEETTIGPLTEEWAIAECDQKDVIISGGYMIEGVDNALSWQNIRVKANEAFWWAPTMQGWTTQVWNGSWEAIIVYVSAVCYDVEPLR